MSPQLPCQIMYVLFVFTLSRSMYPLYNRQHRQSYGLNPHCWIYGPSEYYTSVRGSPSSRPLPVVGPRVTCENLRICGATGRISPRDDTHGCEQLRSEDARVTTNFWIVTMTGHWFSRHKCFIAFLLTAGKVMASIPSLKTLATVHLCREKCGKTKKPAPGGQMTSEKYLSY